MTMSFMSWFCHLCHGYVIYLMVVSFISWLCHLPHGYVIYVMVMLTNTIIECPIYNYGTITERGVHLTLLLCNL